MPEDDLCVTRVPIFQGLTRQEQLRVADFARPALAEKGEIVYAPGQPVSRLLVMHSGQLKVSHAAANGQEQILRTVTDGDVVGERAFLTGHRPNDLAVALEESRMCVFDHADLAVLLRDYPDISQRMLRTLSDRLTSVERLLAAITSSDVNARVAAYLLDPTWHHAGRSGHGETSDGETGNRGVPRHDTGDPESTPCRALCLRPYRIARAPGGHDSRYRCA